MGQKTNLKMLEKERKEFVGSFLELGWVRVDQSWITWWCCDQGNGGAVTGRRRILEGVSEVSLTVYLLAALNSHRLLFPYIQLRHIQP